MTLQPAYSPAYTSAPPQAVAMGMTGMPRGAMPMHVTSSMPAAISHHAPIPQPTASQNQDLSATAQPEEISQEAREAAIAKSGTMRISRFQNGKPVYNWKSNNQEEPTLVQKMLGEDMFMGMSIAAAAMMGLKLAGIVATGGMSMAATAAVMIVPSLVGAAVGGLVNKYHVEKQLRDGVEFEPPSDANKGILSGLAQGITTGGGMTLLGGFLAHKLASTSALSGLSGLAEAMAPSMDTIATAGAASFALPIIMAVGAGLYTAYKNSQTTKDSSELRYEQAGHIYAVQHGHAKGTVAPVKELEEHISNTMKRDYTPEAALVAGTLVGATALHALTGVNAHGAEHAAHSTTHLAAEVAHEASNHAIHHAATQSHTERLASSALSANAGRASMLTNKPESNGSFVDRFAAQRTDSPAAFTERLAQAPEHSGMVRGA